MGTYEWTVQHKGEFSGWSAESAPATFTAVAPPDRLFVTKHGGAYKIDPDTMNVEAGYYNFDTRSGHIEFGQDGYLYVTESHNNSSYSSGGAFMKVDPTDMTEVKKIAANGGATRAVAWGSDGYLYTGGGNGKLRQRDPADLSVIAEYTGHSSTIYGITQGADGYIYSGGGNGTHKIDPATMTQVASQGSSSWSNIWGGDGYLYSADKYSGRVRKIDPSNMNHVGSLGGINDCSGVAYGADGYLYATSYRDDFVQKIDPASLTKVAQVNVVEMSMGVIYGPDGFVYAGRKKIDPATMTIINEADQRNYGVIWSQPRGMITGVSYPYPA